MIWEIILRDFWRALDGDSYGLGQAHDEVCVNRVSGGGVVFPNRAAVAVRHEETIA